MFGINDDFDYGFESQSKKMNVLSKTSMLSISLLDRLEDALVDGFPNDMLHVYSEFVPSFFYFVLLL